MPDVTERHEVRVRGQDQTIVFLADSEDGRLIIRQEPDGRTAKDVCQIALSNPDELRAFFKGLRRILASLGNQVDPVEAPPSKRGKLPAAESAQDDDREAVVAPARQRNAQAFAPWTREEEEEIRRRHQAGESIETIARARKRSPRAVQLRLQRLGVLPSEE